MLKRRLKLHFKNLIIVLSIVASPIFLLTSQSFAYSSSYSCGDYGAGTYGNSCASPSPGQTPGPASSNSTTPNTSNNNVYNSGSSSNTQTTTHPGTSPNQPYIGKPIVFFASSVILLIGILLIMFAILGKKKKSKKED